MNLEKREIIFGELKIAKLTAQIINRASIRWWIAMKKAPLVLQAINHMHFKGSLPSCLRCKKANIFDRIEKGNHPLR